jgi:hypothetical protein
LKKSREIETESTSTWKGEGRKTPEMLKILSLFSCLFFYGFGFQVPSKADSGHFVRIQRALPGGILLLEGGKKIRLQGLEFSNSDFEKIALQPLVGREFRWVEEEKDVDQPKLWRGLLFEKKKKISVNAEVLERGLAWYRVRSKRDKAYPSLQLALFKGRASKKGLWKKVAMAKGKPPFFRGGVLGLYYKESRLDYHKQLRRIRDIGADWVLLLLTVFVPKVDSNKIVKDPNRTVQDRRLKETIRYAKGLGLKVALMPIVLIQDSDNDDDWRGTLRPKNPIPFWLDYDKQLCHYADISRDSQVELFFIGSELCSLEENYPKAWPRVIANLRGRFGGWLSYSVNWDHYDVPKFWGLLDCVGLTAYFELTEKKKASVKELEEGWKKVRKELKAVSKSLGRPIFLTELGYPSQEGANTAPWNYLLAQDSPDPEEQARCFEAFAKVMKDAKFLQGAFIFDFFEEGGEKDTTYALWGKRAWWVVRDLFKDWAKER